MAAVIEYDNEVRAIVATGGPPDLLGRTISVNREMPLAVNFAVALAVLQLPGWTPAEVDQFAALRMTKAIPSGIRYAVISPPLSDSSLSCLIETYPAMRLQLVRRECVNSSIH